MNICTYKNIADKCNISLDYVSLKVSTYFRYLVFFLCSSLHIDGQCLLFLVVDVES